MPRASELEVTADESFAVVVDLDQRAMASSNIR